MQSRFNRLGRSAERVEERDDPPEVADTAWESQPVFAEAGGAPQGVPSNEASAGRAKPKLGKLSETDGRLNVLLSEGVTAAPQGAARALEEGGKRQPSKGNRLGWKGYLGLTLF